MKQSSRQLMVQGEYLGLLVDIRMFKRVIVEAENFKPKVDCDDFFFFNFKMSS
jgi:hypothetical protein